jgi:hypothetical protein
VGVGVDGARFGAVEGGGSCHGARFDGSAHKRGGTATTPSDEHVRDPGRPPVRQSVCLTKTYTISVTSVGRMRRAEELESRVGELEAELQALLDEYVEVQGRIRTLEALAGVEGEAAAERTLADLPERLRRLAAEDREAAADDEHDADAGDRRTAASQAEVAAAVEGVDVTDEGPDSDSDSGSESESEDAADDAALDDEDGLDDIIIG